MAVAHPAPIYRSELVELYQIDCFDWLQRREPSSIHAVVTDPPYGFIEFQESHLEKLKNGRGGVWRIPPSLDGYARSPLPRFTVQTPEELALMSDFFGEWARLVHAALVPGGHIFIATNPLLSTRVYTAIQAAGFEQRGELIRLVTTLRGGDRPKGAEQEFSGVSVMPRSHFEPWGIFRKPCEGRVADNLRKWKTGGLRRISEAQPFADVFACPPAGQAERRIAAHPSLKPQRLMRHLVRASLPLGEGTVLDTFSGSGSTLAAAEAVGYRAIGLEKNPEYAHLAVEAIPALARLPGIGRVTRDTPSSPAASSFLAHLDSPS
ncbi:MAG: site-specific DNA-methyltransferase [Chloroflexi bacterium]|nr:site-specific DNA-methyltransferase [Chloroflexota bacterium]